jgi:hypothetical protein
MVLKFFAEESLEVFLNDVAAPSEMMNLESF